MIRTGVLILFLAVIVGSAHAQQFDFDRTLDMLKQFSSAEFEGRKVGTEGNRKSREFIVDEFNRLGLHPLDSAWYYPFSAIGGMKRKRVEGVNVAGYLLGSDPDAGWIVISAHHDHMGKRDSVFFPGADDNGSGVCALFAVADYFRQAQSTHNLLFVSFDGEELGLLGSRAFLDKCPINTDQIVANINMDMVGRNDQNEIYLCGKKQYPEFFNLFETANEHTAVTVRFGHDGSDGKHNWSGSSDHANFHRLGIPFVYVGVEDHDDYHRPTDTFDKIQPEFYRGVIDLVIWLVQQTNRSF